MSSCLSIAENCFISSLMGGSFGRLRFVLLPLIGELSRIVSLPHRLTNLEKLRLTFK